MNNIWYYISSFIFIFIVIRNSSIDIKNLLLISAIFFILFIVYKKDKLKLNKKIEKIIGNNSEFRNLIVESKFLKDINKHKYQELLDLLLKFIENYELLKSGIKIHHYNNSLILRKEILNILSSYQVSNEYSLEIEDIRQKYKNLLDTFMKNMELEVNQDWKLGEININSSEVYFNDPEPYNQKIDTNFDLY